MTSSNLTNQSAEIDIDDYLADRKLIAAIWGIDDVQETRPDLDDDQAWQVLQYVRKHHDCNDGITWNLLRYMANDLFPVPEDEDEEE